MIDGEHYKAKQINIRVNPASLNVFLAAHNNPQSNVVPRLCHLRNMNFLPAAMNFLLKSVDATLLSLCKSMPAPRAWFLR
ncbi:MAG: hypothetical protein ACJA13_000379 [Paraglaciecola sp.]